jgi:predicted phage-related endonuclease
MTVILDYIEQGSDEWLQARLGRITMSNADKLLTGGKGVTRMSYIIDVASEIASGVPSEKVNTWEMARGTLLEPFARQAYEAHTGLKVKQVGLGYLDENRRISASPDGLTIDGGMEIKCQGAKAHLRTIIDAKNPKKFTPQIQGSMWVFETETWDYCSFCPEFKTMPLFVMRVNRDEEIIKQIQDSALKAVFEVDEYVKLAREEPNETINAICNEAIELIDIMQNKEVEIY